MRAVSALLALVMLALALCLVTVNANPEPASNDADVTTLASLGDLPLDAIAPELPAVRIVSLESPEYSEHRALSGRLAPSDIFQPPRI